MRPASFLILLVVTLAVGAAAVASYLAERRTDTLDVAGEPLFPDLAGRLEAVRSVEVVSPAGGYVLRRLGDGWVAASKHSYPVKVERVNRTLVALARMEKLEPKTRRPELYPRIHVADPEAESAKSRLLRLKARGGKVLAELIVGKQRHGKTGRADSGTYVRQPDAARAWLAAGLLDLSDEVYPWLRNEVVDLEAEAVKRVDLRPRDGRRLLAVRPKRGAKAMGVAGVPDGRQPDVAKVRRLGSVLSAVKFDDVRPEDALDFRDPLARGEVATFDGLRIATTVVRRDGAYWLRLRAEAGADATETARKRAETVNERVDGWAYKVQAYIGERLSQSLDDVLTPAGQTQG